MAERQEGRAAPRRRGRRRRGAPRLVAVACAVWACTASAAPGPAAGPGGDGPWTWPVGPGPSGPGVLAPFDPPPEPWAAGHRGADLRAAAGDAVRAPAAGRVGFVGTVVDRPVLTIVHSPGVVTSYEPVVASVAPGEPVAAGQGVGTVAAGGHCSLRCLHWGLRVDGAYLDPLDTIRDRRPSVLLPVPDG